MRRYALLVERIRAAIIGCWRSVVIAVHAGGKANDGEGGKERSKKNLLHKGKFAGVSWLKDKQCGKALQNIFPASSFLRLVRIFLSMLLLVCFTVTAKAQQVHLRVRDAVSKAPVPFAAIRYGSAGQGVIADLDGLASLPYPKPDETYEIGALGYKSLKLSGLMDSIIFLQPKNESLGEVVVKPDFDKLRRIIRRSVAARDAHNPERYDWYRCKVYYKMLADAAPRDTASNSEGSRELAAMADNQHLIVSETYSRRTYKRPQQLQEEVLATRFSGFQTPMFTSLVTDMLPFHCYTDYLRLNGRDFRNPVSAGSSQWFTFNLKDELLQGGDTLWIISFFPKKAGEGLRGQVYINSRDFAVTNFIGSYADSVLGSSIRVEQRYIQIGERWFPQQLNYVYRITQGNQSDGFFTTLQGTSRIDSVSFDEQAHFRFDKRHTVKLDPVAGKIADSVWNAFRPQALDAKEARTYVFMDSLVGSVNGERYLPYLSKLAEGKVPLGPVDVNIERLYNYNSYEGNRVGFGLQTNDRISRHTSLGGWAGYGFHDQALKWGGFAEVYTDALKESFFRISYDHDLRDPGRIQLHRELDNSYLRNYLISRADMVDAASLSFHRQFGYLNTTIAVRNEHVVPQYDYAWNWEGRNARDYTANEASVQLRYAFAERSAPMFGKYFTTGSAYPILYAKGTYGMLDIGSTQVNYSGLLGAIAWQKHIAQVGTEHWLIEGGKLWSDAPLPLGKLFAAPGIRHDKSHLYLFGGLQTVYPYAFYSDAFVFASWRHDFDWRFYKLQFGQTGGSMPGLCLVYNGLLGSLSNPAVQNTFSFAAPDTGYQEAGFLVRDLVRLQYMHLYYLGLNAGYFHPLQPSGRDGGTFVLGLNVSL